MKRTSRVAVCTSQLGDSALTRVASGTTAVRAIASLWQSSTAQFDDHSASIPALRRPSRIRFQTFEGARIAARIAETRVVRLPCRDRPESRAGRQREVMLHRFTGLRFVTGQSQRRDEACMWIRSCWSRSRSPGAPSRSPDRTASARNRSADFRQYHITQHADRAD